MSPRTVTPTGPFELDAAIGFLLGFTPAAWDGGAGGHLHLAIVVEGTWEPAAVCATAGDGGVDLASAGPGAGEAAEDQLARILSLDVDASGFDDVCADDPVLRAVRQRHAGLRPVLFPSVVAALGWAILSQRVRMAQAAAAAARVAASHGSTVSIHGEDLDAFPTPAALVDVGPMRGVTETKAERLRALGPAVVDGDLTATSLREDPEAIDRLSALEGIGPFSAELALVRGAGAPDVFPSRERRLHAIMRRHYDLVDAPVTELAAIADGWRPFRSWAALLLRTDGA